MQIGHDYFNTGYSEIKKHDSLFFLRKKIHHVRPDGLIRPCALIDFRIVSFEQECTMYERVSSSHLNWSILWRCGWCKARTFRMGLDSL